MAAAENFERLHTFFLYFSNQLQATFGFGIPDLSWWGWIAIAAGCWLLQAMMTVRTSGGSVGAWLVRLTFIAGTLCSTFLGVSNGLRWMWQS